MYKINTKIFLKPLDKSLLLLYNNYINRKEVFQMKQAFTNLDNAVNDFLQEFFEDYHAQVGLDFFCDLDECLIEYAIFGIEKDADSFYNNFTSRFPIVKNFSIFTLSLLHELGHLETEDIIIDDTEERNKDLTNDEYYNLYNEKIATDWAGEWITNNFNKAKKINDIFIKLLDIIYQKMLDKDY